MRRRACRFLCLLWVGLYGRDDVAHDHGDRFAATARAPSPCQPASSGYLRRVLIRQFTAVCVLLVAAGCVEKRKPASAEDAKPAPAKSAPAAEAPSSGKIVEDYAKNLGTAPARAAAVVDIVSIQKAVAAFEAMEGRNPKSLDELVAMRYLPQLPPVPPGKRLSYDAATGKVELVPK